MWTPSCNFIQAISIGLCVGHGIGLGLGLGLCKCKHNISTSIVSCFEISEFEDSAMHTLPQNRTWNIEIRSSSNKKILREPPFYHFYILFLGPEEIFIQTCSLFQGNTTAIVRGQFIL